MDKQLIKFRKYTNKEDFNSARSEEKIAEGDITFVTETKEIYVGNNIKYSKRTRNRGGGPVIVDKIYSKNICILPCHVPIGYRVGYRLNQDVYVSIADMLYDPESNLFLVNYVADPSEVSKNLSTSLYSWDKNLTVFRDSYRMDVILNIKGVLYEKCLHNNQIVVDEADTTGTIAFRTTFGQSDKNHIRRYFAILINTSARSGFFEKEKNGWQFYPAALIIGNNGSKRIENNQIIHKSLAFNLENCQLSYTDFRLLLSELAIEYCHRLHMKSQSKYHLYVKYRRKKRINKNGDVAHPHRKKWYRLSHRVKYIDWSSRALLSLFDKLNIIQQYSGLIPWSAGLQNRLPGRPVYKLENNKINKYFLIKYLDFKIGKEMGSDDDIIYDEHCIAFRSYFGKDKVYIEKKHDIFSPH